MSSDPYLIEDASSDLQGHALLRRWRTLLAASDSHERIYQSPEFFQFLLATTSAQAAPRLYAIRERHSGSVIGLVPVAQRQYSLAFNAGRWHAGTVPLHCVSLLGSAPLMPVSAELLTTLTGFLLAQFPHCQAISLPALAADSALWDYLHSPSVTLPGCRPHLLTPWCDCHQIPLPADAATYLAQFSAKRRYNLKRQQRQLREHGNGTLRLHRLVGREQVAQLAEALARLAPPAKLAQLWSVEEMQQLAQHGLLWCYLADTDSGPCALLLGLRAGSTVHLFNIVHDAALEHLSVGTTVLQLAIGDLCASGVRCIDLGYGTPAQRYQSSNVTVRRAHVLLMRAGLKNRLLCAAHGGFSAAVAWGRRWSKTRHRPNDF